jgi:hypothetical protein
MQEDNHARAACCVGTCSWTMHQRAIVSPSESCHCAHCSLRWRARIESWVGVLPPWDTDDAGQLGLTECLVRGIAGHQASTVAPTPTSTTTTTITTTTTTNNCNRHCRRHHHHHHHHPNHHQPPSSPHSTTHNHCVSSHAHTWPWGDSRAGARRATLHVSDTASQTQATS